MGAHRFRRTYAAAMIVASLGLVAACGSDGGSTVADDPSPTASSSTAGSATATPSETASDAVPDGPDCADVWVEGQDLDQGYTGCVADGAWVEIEKTGCSSGQTQVRYDDAFWAVKGGEIHEAKGSLMKDKAYLKDLSSCIG